MPDQRPNRTLHEAMKIVLLEHNSRSLSSVELSKEIEKRILYLKKDGSFADSSQIRARARRYPGVFRMKSPDIIMLK